MHTQQHALTHACPDTHGPETQQAEPTTLLLSQATPVEVIRDSNQIPVWSPTPD